MDAIRFLIDFILHIDVHLVEIVRQAGGWTYGVLGLIVFCETGLVVLYGGYAFGGLPAVEENFSLVVLGVIGVSVLPIVFEVVRGMLKPSVPEAVEDARSARAADEAAETVEEETAR